MKDNLYLYPNLVSVRKKCMTQNELASMIGISQQEISRYESGEVKAPINYICDLADCCKVSVDYILGRDPLNSADTHKDDDKETLLKLYNKLSDVNKIKILERMETLLEIQSKK
ncbi:helix-turn-helix domain-containing protein [uncultured Ruminococcus sp.]|uniref:helix-turn-helix domain-containing protein n=1 Tax=uncultured Ruminococcus sp. TaxID=165186 RepID=UPI0025D07DE7|nr:helix-turn-helix domain-containing protein [uncultured Ruminococcus sp.]